MKQTNLWMAFSLIIGATVVFSGCMTLPNNNQDLGTRRTLQVATGYLVEPNKEVYLEALIQDPTDADYGDFKDVSYNLVTGRNYRVTSSSTRTNTSGYPWDGGALYSWSMFYHIPNECWRWSTAQRKYYARLRVRSNGSTLPNGNLYTFKEGFYESDWENTTVADIGAWQDADSIITVWADR